MQQKLPLLQLRYVSSYSAEFSMSGRVLQKLLCDFHSRFFCNVDPQCKLIFLLFRHWQNHFGSGIKNTHRQFNLLRIYWVGLDWVVFYVPANTEGRVARPERRWGCRRGTV